LNKRMADSPIIIIGAGRSGTNMLRNVLTELSGLGTWPCDEINYIWRHGNAHFPNDEFSPAMASSRVKNYVRKAFESIQRKGPFERVVEKTCANSLRVGFVQAIFPQAQMIHLLRDGRDVVASSFLRWRASVDLPYLLRKARFVPLCDLPYYAARYFANRAQKTLSRRKTLASWGPRISGMETIIRNQPLEVVCAIQWRRCVESASAGFKNLEAGKGMTIKYEEFVRKPRQELKKIVKFLGMEQSDDAIDQAVQKVSSKSAGRWKERLGMEIQERVEEEIAGCLQANGYQVDVGKTGALSCF